MPLQKVSGVSGGQTADGFGNPTRVDLLEGLVALLNVTAISGSLQVWLQGSVNGVDWFDVGFDTLTTHTGTGADFACTFNRRNLNGPAAATATMKSHALFRDWGLDWVRVAWTLTGTATFSVDFSGK